ncbi:MAG: LOG family protein [Dialister invisus]
MEKGKRIRLLRFALRNQSCPQPLPEWQESFGKNGYHDLRRRKCGPHGYRCRCRPGSRRKVVGIIPEVFIAAEQAHRLITELIEVPDLMARKRKMIEAGDAFLILPGGFGTLEEFADTAVHYHIYTEETNRPPIIIANIEGIYDPLRALFENWKSAEFITADEWENIHFISSIKELLPLFPEK